MATAPRARRFIVATALVPGPVAACADAAFVTAFLRERESLNNQASAALGQPARVFHLTALFDGPGNAGGFGTPGFENNVLVVEADFRLRDPDARFFEAPAPWAGDGPPNYLNTAFVPTLRWDTYVSLGVYDINLSGTGNTGFFVDWFEPGGGLSENTVKGSWYNANPPGGGGDLGSADQFGEVFLGQFTVLGLDPISSRGDGEEPEIPEVPPTTHYIETDVFAGKFSIFTQMIDGGAAEHQVFYIPSPAPITVALIAGAAGAARRRR